MLQVSPVTTHRIAMNGANMIVSSHHRAGEAFQNDAESPRCDVKGTGLEPDTIRVRHPETLLFQVDVSNEVFAAPSIRIETVGETVEGSDRHMFSYCVSASVVTPSGSDYFFSGAAGASEDDAGVAGKSELNMSAATFHLPSACFFQTSQYLPVSLVPSFIVIA